MASKKAATNQELDDLFAQIGDGDGSNTSNTNNPAPAAKPQESTNDADDEVFADIKSQLNVPSRTSTPQAPSSVASTKKYTPTSSNSGRSSEEKPAGAASSNKEATSASVAPGQKAADESKDASKPASAAGGWWGGFSGLSSFATTAVKQAQGAVEQLQKNEDAQKWVEQAKGNYGLLRGLGADLGSRALPTFTNILHTLAPPISQHERLQIHITHDIVGYPSLDPLIYQSFSRVMAQVEGGDLLVIQRGSESGQRRPSEIGYAGSGSAGWADGPWWQSGTKRSLNAVQGMTEGTKLARASAEAYSQDFYTSRGGLEEAMKQATSVLSESNPTRTSDIFVCIQPIAHTSPSDLFAAGKDSKDQSEGDKIVKDESDKPDRLVAFAIYLHDPIHSIAFSAISQSLPQKWVDWMDAESPSSIHDGTQFVPMLPEDIQEIVASGGVDPREWIAEWVEELLSLSVGIVAQRYVARRMGVGEGGIGRGKRREEAVESGGGEAARAI